MKKTTTLLAIFTMFAATTVFAQVNENRERETVTTQTTVRDNEGVSVSRENVTVSRSQAIELSEADANQVNQEVAARPTKINTEVSYSIDGKRYHFVNETDSESYRLVLMSDNERLSDYPVIRPAPRDGYYTITKGEETSYGFFNQNGDFVVENYDGQGNKVVPTVYKLD